MLLIDVLTLFPGICSGAVNESILKRAINSKILKVKLHNIRDYSKDKHHKVDDKPFGGGPGMVIKIDPVYDALQHVLKGKARKKKRVMLLSPQGKVLTQDLVRDLAKEKHLVLICGHYEGVDERIRDNLVTDEISIGDYVLTGGELAAMVLIDTVVRFLPNALGDQDSAEHESLSGGLLEYPQYTRPAKFKDFRVPEVLLSGDHKAIEKWRQKESRRKTLLKRPDLIKNFNQFKV